MTYERTCSCMLMQAWAFASGVRKLVDKSPPMNMLQFDKEVWLLHRKLHQRFLKFRKYFVEAGEDLAEYKLREGANNVSASAGGSDSASASKTVICLLSDESHSSGDDE